MPTLAELEDLNGVLEGGFAAGVNDALGVMPFLLAGDFQRATPRVEIVVSLNNATGARRRVPGLLQTRFVRWNFTVKFSVITLPAASLTRAEGETVDAFRARQNNNFQLHQEMVARVRGYASTAAQNSWGDTNNFPWHFIAEALRDTTNLKKIKQDDGYNQTALTFAGVIGIRENAWPIPTNPIPPAPPESGPILDDDSGAILDDDATPVLSD